MCAHEQDKKLYGVYPQYIKFLAITDLAPDLSRGSRPHAVYTKGKSQCRSLFSLHTHTHTLQVCTPRDHDYPHQTYFHVAVGAPSGRCRLIALLALLPVRLLFHIFMQGSIRTPRSFVMRCAVLSVECSTTATSECVGCRFAHRQITVKQVWIWCASLGSTLQPRL
jgi:hypothetical protein